MLQCVELGDALEIHDRIISDFYAGQPHIHTPLPGRTLYLEVGTCVLYIEVVVCVYAYGHLIWRVVYTYIIMCIYHVAWIHIHTLYRYDTHMCIQPSTVDREIFALKIIRVKIFRVDKFSRFRSIREIFLTVDDCNMDERLESLWLLVYYQVSGEPGIARCSHRSDIYLGECGLARKLIH